MIANAGGIILIVLAAIAALAAAGIPILLAIADHYTHQRCRMDDWQ